MRHLMCAALVAALVLPVRAQADHHETPAPEAAATPSVDEQIAGLETMCAESSAARAARDAESSLFERLGGEAGIRALVAEIMKLHMANPSVGHFFAAADSVKSVDRAARFFISRTGGPDVYEGPSVKAFHGPMKISNADFLAAGADIFQALKNLGYGQAEIDDFVCLLVGLREEVVHTPATESAEE